MLSPEQDLLKPVKYGELIVLGYNGSLPNGDRGRRKSRFALFRRPKANGVKPSTVHSTCSAQTARAISNKDQHSVSYTLSRTQTVVVEYTHDSTTDMFQIGRSTESPIDFVVMDTVAGCKANSDTLTSQSTISRFACRIVCQRAPPYTAHIYAAGFDSSKSIFLGEKAAKWWCSDSQMDGLTTNGVLVMQPRHGFTCESKPGPWREISVCGNVFTLRETRSAQKRGKLLLTEQHTARSMRSCSKSQRNEVEHECHELTDGTLIDLCGATLLWRSAEGLSRTPSLKQLEELRRELNAARPQCPVGLHTLAFPSLQRSIRTSSLQHQPWAYLRCGHVHGYHAWRGRRRVSKHGSTEEEEDEDQMEVQEGEREMMEGERECPLCRTRGLYVPLKLGRESGLYLDGAPPTHAFNPCGHVCSERTAAFWSDLLLPHGAHGFHNACPFCVRPLARDMKCVRLIFQGPLD